MSHQVNGYLDVRHEKLMCESNTVKFLLNFLEYLKKIHNEAIAVKKESRSNDNFRRYDDDDFN